MNRINFARCSGVIVDVCRGHGTWFDASELREIVEFIRGGGLELAPKREREIESERERLRLEQTTATQRVLEHNISFQDEMRVAVISAAHGLLKFLIE